MKPRAPKADDLRPEYDMTELLKGGVMGKYASRFAAGTNLVLIEPEIYHEFKTDKAVNDALRLVIELRKIDGRSRKPAASRPPRLTPHPHRRRSQTSKIIEHDGNGTLITLPECQDARADARYRNGAWYGRPLLSP